MDKNVEIKNLQEEVSLLKEKLNISQSLVKIGFWEFNRQLKRINLSDEALQILQINRFTESLSVYEFARAIGKDKFHLINKRINELEFESDEIDFEFTLDKPPHENNTWIKVIANTRARSIINPELIIGIVQDISDQKRNEQQLLQAKEKAEEADVLKSAFLANMSHEIRTPLNAIVGFSKLLTNPEIMNEQRNEYSEYITSSANNLLNLIRDIVDVSKIEAGKILIEESVCEINKKLKELKITFEKEKENQSKSEIDIILNLSVKDEEFAIKTDPYRFHQIMVNLIGNALKFIEKGFIEFGYIKKSDSFLEFYVKDTGIGIPDDKKDLIFSRFGQIINNKIKNPGGTGLGLSITKHLVERLGGTIWVESVQGKGTSFYFTLPFKTPDASDIKTETAILPIDELKNKKLSLLAVEDDAINMILLEDTIHHYLKNVTIEKASNGKEAIEILKANDFDLIIMDIRMPVMDGYEATSIIRKDFEPPKNKIPVLGLSAHALKEEINKGKQLGMNEFLSKPITPEELIAKITWLTGNPRQEKIIENEQKNREVDRDHQQFNTSFLENIFKNDESKLRKTLETYLHNIPEQLNILSNSIKFGQVEKLKITAHALKSTFKYLNRFDLSDLSRDIEYSSSDCEAENRLGEKLEILNKEWKSLKQEIEKSLLLKR